MDLEFCNRITVNHPKLSTLPSPGSGSHVLFPGTLNSLVPSFVSTKVVVHDA